MKHQNKYKRGAAFLAVALVLVSVFTSLLAPPKTQAASATASMCVPHYIKAGGNHWKPTGWLSVKVIDRWHVKVEYLPQGDKCAYPTTLNDKYIDLNQQLWTDFANETLAAVNSKIQDGKYTVKHGGSSDDDTRIDHINWKAPGDNGDWGNYAIVGSDYINNVFKDGEWMLGIEDDGYGGHDLVPDCPGTNSNFRLHYNSNNSGVTWDCEDTYHFGAGAYIREALKNSENFNIVFKASEDGKTITSLAPGANTDDSTFVWCNTEYRNNKSCASNDSITGVTPQQIAGSKSPTMILNLKTKSGNVIRVKASTPSNPDIPAGSATGSEVADNSSCEAKGWTLGWIMCPVINGIADGIESIYTDLIAPLLESHVDTNPNSNTFQAWSSFRVIANILLVIFLLVIVFAQTIGGGFVDAYTARKIVPRILVAAILINISIYLVAAAVDITNILGKGVAQLIFLPFSGSDTLNFSVGTLTTVISIAGIIGTGGVLWAAIAVGSGGAIFGFVALFILLPALIAFLGAFLTIFLRQVLIMFLVLIAPVAFALYCLPNTEQYFRKWWDLFFKTLMVYPIVMAIFALATIAPSIIELTGNNSIIADFIKIIALILPLFLIPFAFKFAGGAISTLYGTITGRGKQFGEFFKGNANDPNSLRNRTKRRGAEGLTMAQARYTDRGRELGAGRFRRGFGAMLDKVGNVDSRLAKYNAQSREEAEQMSATGRDALRYAAAGYQDGGNYYDSKGRQISKNLYNRGKQLYGFSASGISQNLEYTLRKAQTDEDFGNFRTAFARNAQQNNWSQDEINDAWAASTFPHKASLAASEWYSKPELDTNTGAIRFKDISNDTGSYGSFISDLHKTRLSYQLPARDQDFRAMYKRQTDLEDKIIGGGTLTADEATQLAQTYEVFDAASQTYSTVGATGGGAAGGAPTEVTKATAGTAASQPIIEQALAQRSARGFSLSSVDAGTRSIDRSAAPGAAPTPLYTGVVVTGDADRTSIPRVVP